MSVNYLKKCVSAVLLAALLTACASGQKRQPVTMEEAIAIARQHVKLNERSTYRASATFLDDEWRVLFESDSEYVGDYVYVHVRSDGAVRKVEGGY